MSFLSYRYFVYPQQWSQLYTERYLGNYLLLTYSKCLVNIWWMKVEQIFALSFLFCTVNFIEAKTMSLTTVFLHLAQGMLGNRCSINIWQINNTFCWVLLTCQVPCEKPKCLNETYRSLHDLAVPHFAHLPLFPRTYPKLRSWFSVFNFLFCCCFFPFPPYLANSHSTPYTQFSFLQSLPPPTPK